MNTLKFEWILSAPQGCHLLLNLPCLCPFNICPSSSTWWIRSSHFLFIRCSCVQNRFPNQFCILDEQLSSASNENKCGMYNLNGRQVFFTAACIYRTASNCQVQYAYPSAHSQCKFVVCLFWEIWPSMWLITFILIQTAYVFKWRAVLCMG